MTTEAHQMGELQSRNALPADLEWLLDLRLATMNEHFERSGHKLSLAEQRDRLIQSYSAIQIIQKARHDIGMTKVVREPDVWHLVQIQLLPEYQRQGIGTFMIERLIVEARHANVPVSLHVLKVNPAKGLYERLGFNVTSDLGHSYEMRTDA